MFNATNSTAIISKPKNLFWLFFCISKIYISFRALWKRRWASENICLWNYWLKKAGLLKCLKSPVSEHLYTVNMLKGPKNWLNLLGRIFVIFFWSFRKKISSKNSLLGVSKILRLFVNGTSSNAIISKSRNMLWIFSCISEIYIKFEKLWTRRWSSEVICFRKL